MVNQLVEILCSWCEYSVEKNVGESLVLCQILSSKLLMSAINGKQTSRKSPKFYLPKASDGEFAKIFLCQIFVLHGSAS